MYQKILIFLRMIDLNSKFYGIDVVETLISEKCLRNVYITLNGGW